MQEDYTILIKNGVDVWSVKTDAFTIRHEHLSKAKKAVTLNSSIGGWRHEKGKSIIPPTEQNKMKDSLLTTIPEYTNETLEIKDEWDTESIAKQITQHSPLIIRSTYAGGGKSHIPKHFSKLGHKMLFVVPTEQLFAKYR